MTRKDGIVVGSRVLATVIAIWALTDVSYLPAEIHSFVRYAAAETPLSEAIAYWRHHYLIEVGFTITRIVGYSMMSVWLYRCGPEIEELLLPMHLREGVEN